MITIKHLGTCSGTEPEKNLHHNSFVLQVNGVNYWFDAGENCAHYAHLSGIDVMKTKALFVSHTHIDHIGGMANLFHTMFKMIMRFKKEFVANKLKVFIPSEEILECVKNIAFNGRTIWTPEHAYSFVEYNPMFDGVIFEDENIKVTTIHNKHLYEDGSNGWHSFSYLIEAEGKKIVFSGDVQSSSELDPLLADGCDLLMHETGHHKVQAVIDYAVSKNVKCLRLVHHGREIIDNTKECLELMETSSKKYGIPMDIVFDLQSFEL